MMARRPYIYSKYAIVKLGKKRCAIAKASSIVDSESQLSQYAQNFLNEKLSPTR